MRLLPLLVLGLGLSAAEPLQVKVVSLPKPQASIQRQALFVNEVPGIQSESVVLSPQGKTMESPSQEEDRVFLVTKGSGQLKVQGQAHAVGLETIAHFAVGEAVEIEAGKEGLSILILRSRLTPADREDLKGFGEASRTPYVKAFKACEAYGESIKSARTVSRTLLPKNIVPRMAIGTVETTGPDLVKPHRHPMLEQYFLGLTDNDITVLTDDVRTPLKSGELLHIPLGSNHGAEVAEGKKLYYVWMDFFQDAKGQEWLNEHKPLPQK